MIYKLIAIIFLCFWLFIGLYIGMGGISRVSVDEISEQIDAKKEALQKDTVNYSYKRVTYKTLYDFEIAMESQDIIDYFPWANSLNQFSSLVLTAMSFGIIGSVISILIEISFRKIAIESTSYIAVPLLGSLTGLVVLGLSYVLPTIIIKGTSEIRPLSLMFVCLFCGIYSNKFYDRLESTFEKTFITKK